MQAASLVRTTRRQAGLTQRQLAIRTSTTTSAISRLERGHVSPTVDTLRHLLRAMGHDLRLHAEPLATDVDTTQLEAAANLTPTDRLEQALASLRSLDGLVGDARSR